MQDIEPYFKWRDYYIAEEDVHSPFYRRKYNEFAYDKHVYNYFIHPQWDDIGSETLYIKILFVDYEKNYAIIECIGEATTTMPNLPRRWNRDLWLSSIFPTMLCESSVWNESIPMYFSIMILIGEIVALFRY